jgi:hypothetical protein
VAAPMEVPKHHQEEALEGPRMDFLLQPQGEPGRIEQPARRYRDAWELLAVTGFLVLRRDQKLASLDSSLRCHS